MPYSAISDLPPQVREHLNSDEQAQWLAVFNAVYDQTGDEEKAFMAAWGAVRRDRSARSVGLVQENGLVLVKGWGMLFTDPLRRDWFDTYFDGLTNLLTEFYQDAPLWYEHGDDPAYGWRPIGKRHAVAIYGYGVWAEHELFQDHSQFQRTTQEIRDGLLSYSSDSIAHYAKDGYNPANGHMRVWPLAGWALTQAPAERGLGPVTLDGFEATIREVAASRRSRVPSLDARAVITLTDSPSVYSPPAGPTAAAVRTIDPQAWEARDQTSFVTNRMEGTTPMNPEMLAALAKFLGVEATPEAVATALRELITTLEGGTEAAQTAGVDVAAVRSALELADDTDEAEITAALSTMLGLLEPPVYDYQALRSARQQFAQADRTPDPVTHSLPHQVQDEEDGEYEDRPAARSRSLHAVNVNRGISQPTVAHAILAALGYMPPGFRGTLQAARARLFQRDRAARAVNSGEGAGGGWVLNAEVAADILRPLTASIDLFAAGATRWPMEGIDSVTIRKQVGVPGAYWAAENTEITGEDARWATMSLTLKELRAPTTWPNRWLRNLAAGAETIIRDEMVKAMRRKLMISALFGTGSVPVDGGSTGAEPLGIRYTPGVTVTALSPAKVLDLSDLLTAVAALEDANVDETDTWGWLSHSRIFRNFEFMRDENGQPILRNSWTDGVRVRSLVDYPYFKTNAVPKNLGTLSNESVLFFGSWQELIIGMGSDVELLVSEHLKMNYNSTYVMAVAYADTAVAYPEAFHVTTGVL